MSRKTPWMIFVPLYLLIITSCGSLNVLCNTLLNGSAWSEACKDSLFLPQLNLPPPTAVDYLVKVFAAGLSKAGHNVTLFVSDRRDVEHRPKDYTLERYPGLFSSEEGDAFLQSTLTKLLSGSNSLIELARVLKHYMKNCHRIFSQGRSHLQQLKRNAYDLIIIDANELCGFLLAQELGVSHVVFSTGMWIPTIANPLAPTSYVPEFNSLLSDRMTFFNRAYNAAFRLGGHLLTHVLIYPFYNFLILKHRIGYASDQRQTATPSVTFLSHLIGKSEAWLLCTDTAMEFPGPRYPNVEYVGGFLAQPGRPLPEDLLRFADESKDFDGFIAVSFGAGSRRLTPKLEMIFARVFSRLPCRVIWRYNLDVPLDLGAHVKIVEWFPQNDLLAHPNIVAFVGHGGTNSVYECLYHAVPLVGIPFFGDQYDSMVRIQAKGMGIYLNWKTMTETIFENAICQVITNPRYKHTITYYSLVHRDTLLPPVDRAVRRINYTLRYKGAPHLRPAVLDLSFIQSYQLDLLIAFILSMAAAYWGLFYVTRRNRMRVPRESSRNI